MTSKSKDQELEDRAAAEILKEAERGREREKTLGTEGWRKPSSRPNKLFIGRSLASALRQTRYEDKVMSRKTSANSSKGKRNDCSRSGESSSKSALKRSLSPHENSETRENCHKKQNFGYKRRKEPKKMKKKSRK